MKAFCEIPLFCQFLETNKWRRTSVTKPCNHQNSVFRVFAETLPSHSSLALVCSMQESRWQSGPVDTANISPVRLQQLYNDVHHPLFPPDADNSPPPYSSVDDPPSRWWDDGAKNILCGHNLKDIELVCRFRTYSDDNLPRKILRIRPPAVLSSFFLSLHGGDRQTVDDLTSIRKSKE